MSECARKMTTRWPRVCLHDIFTTSFTGTTSRRALRLTSERGRPRGEFLDLEQNHRHVVVLRRRADKRSTSRRTRLRSSSETGRHAPRQAPGGPRQKSLGSFIAFVIPSGKTREIAAPQLDRLFLPQRSKILAVVQVQAGTRPSGTSTRTERSTCESRGPARTSAGMAARA